MNDDELLALLALKFTPKVGDITAKKIISSIGNPVDIFKTKKESLLHIQGIGTVTAAAICQKTGFNQAEQELKFIRKNNIEPHVYYEKNYPTRLLECVDGPFLFFTKGQQVLNQPKVISIVGTRKATEYGKEFTEKLIADLVPYQVVIVSGLAYGVDICAHKAAIKNKLPTVGVMANGLHKIYPSAHKNTAIEMLEQGALLTEFTSFHNSEQAHFPMRNRIIAGVCDALIMVETAMEGGSLITATQANIYNREVFALPGRTGDTYSSGCNYFIKTHRATLVESAFDVIDFLQWDVKKQNSRQISLFTDVSPEEQAVLSFLDNEILHIDDLSSKLNYAIGELPMLLLDMELKGLIKNLPGSRYKRG
jgi:DNA processing protein